MPTPAPLPLWLFFANTRSSVPDSHVSLSIKGLRFIVQSTHVSPLLHKHAHKCGFSSPWAASRPPARPHCAAPTVAGAAGRVRCRALPTRSPEAFLTTARGSPRSWLMFLEAFFTLGGRAQNTVWTCETLPGHLPADPTACSRRGPTEALRRARTQTPAAPKDSEPDCWVQGRQCQEGLVASDELLV